MTSDEIKYSLGGKKNNHASVTLFNNEVYIHLRQFLETKEGKLYPTKKGVALTLEEFRNLESILVQINKDIDRFLNKLVGAQIEMSDQKRTPVLPRVMKRKDQEEDTLPPMKRKKKQVSVKKGGRNCELTVDEIDEEQEEKEILRMLKESYAEVMHPMIMTMIKERCFGCQVDHPSQVQHDICTMTEYEDQIDMFFQEAFEGALNDVRSKWLEKVNHRFQYKVPNCLLKFRDDVWTANVTSEEFTKDIRNLLLQI